MKIQCDVCEKGAATVICCADEAALCARCDLEVHAANRLAGKHQRLPLEFLSQKLPRCDICQEKTAFIFCVQDRALFCEDCDEAIHIPGTLSAGHQRFLATGVSIGFKPVCNKDMLMTGSNNKPPKWRSQPYASNVSSAQQFSLHPDAWAVDEFLQLSDYETNDLNVQVQKESPLGTKELEWFAEIGIFQDQMHQEAVKTVVVPELSTSRAMPAESLFRTGKSSGVRAKKPRIEKSEEDFRIVPDLQLS